MFVLTDYLQTQSFNWLWCQLMTTFLLIILFNLLLKKLLLAMLELVQNVLQLIILQTNDIAIGLSRTVCSVLILKCEHVKMIPAKPRHVSIVTRSVLAYGLSWLLCLHELLKGHFFFFPSGICELILRWHEKRDLPPLIAVQCCWTVVFFLKGSGQIFRPNHVTLCKFSSASLCSANREPQFSHT